MKTKIVEVTQRDVEFNWGKFLVAQFDDDEKSYHSALPGYPDPLLRTLGWAEPDRYVWVLDLQTGEGALFMPGSSPTADLNKHRVWVCPMFEPFLHWLYSWWKDAPQPIDVTNLPKFVELDTTEGGLYGYRRART